MHAVSQPHRLPSARNWFNDFFYIYRHKLSLDFPNTLPGIICLTKPLKSQDVQMCLDLVPGMG